MSDFSTELPFPDRGNSASAELLKEYYRPERDIPRIPVEVSNAVIFVIPAVKMATTELTKAAVFCLPMQFVSRVWNNSSITPVFVIVIKSHKELFGKLHITIRPL